MRLKMLITAAVAVLAVGIMTLPMDAEAKRFGGGASLGKQSSNMQRQAQPQRPPQQQAQGQPAGQSTAAAGQRPAGATGASRWLGPLAGLAAGGLLAALFFGDAFEGLQVMDFILIALLILGGVMLFRLLRRGQAQPTVAPAGAGGVTLTKPSPLGVERREQDGAAGHAVWPARSNGSGLASGDDETPSWFDDAGFVEGAKTHFIRLQTAWDHSDFQEISDYTTPELLAQLQRERDKTTGSQSTEVVRLNAELVGIRREDDLVVASVLFSGLIREEAQGVAEPFSEIWHVQHPWGSASGDWLIAGIQQVES